VSLKCYTTGTISGAGTAYPYGEHEFIPIISGVGVAQPLLFCVVFCRSLFHFLLIFAFSVFLRFTVTDYLLLRSMITYYYGH